VTHSPEPRRLSQEKVPGIVSLNTALCKLLDIRIPIMQAGMSLVATPTLAAAVSNAGALGVIGSGLHRGDPDRLRDTIAEVRSLTNRPFGVDIVLAPEYLDPTRLRGQAEEMLAALSGDELIHTSRVLDNLTAGSAERFVEICAQERVAVVVSALGSPGRWIDPLHAAGVKVFSLIGSFRQARRVSDEGVDAVIATGSEAGGHTGAVGSLPLWNACARDLPVPVVAAGGIADGRSLAAAFMTGCVGAWIGSRFVATHEARAHDRVKGLYVSSTVDDFVITRSFTGKPMRAARNSWTREWESRAGDILPFPLQIIASGGSTKALWGGEVETGAVPGGQAAGLIDNVLPAADVVRAIAEEAEAVLMHPPGLQS
jgi:enoyl-[acyl-carrier protein] reductase II